ncbi:MAG TPA: hypothetical protein VGY54_17275 [Polyangiaceae bacterium]|nr:hypothetical protein [Polyangiaceae bacterium]
MRTHDNDTLPDPPLDGGTEDAADPAPTAVETEPGPAPEAGGVTRAGSSMDEPLADIFRKFVQRKRVVPNSFEQGIAYQTVHNPARARALQSDGPSIQVSATTDSGLQRKGRTRSEVTTETPSRNARVRSRVLAAMAAALAVVLVLFVILLRSARTDRGHEPQAVRRDTVPATTIPPALTASEREPTQTSPGPSAREIALPPRAALPLRRPSTVHPRPPADGANRLPVQPSAKPRLPDDMETESPLP